MRMRSVSGSFFSASMRLTQPRRAQIGLQPGDVDAEEVRADVLMRDGVDRRARRVHGAGDLDRLDREARVALRVPIGEQRTDDDAGRPRRLCRAIAANRWS